MATKKSAKKTGTTKTIKVTQIRSMIGRTERQIATIRGLGLRRMHHTVEVEDTPCTRGMIDKVAPFIRIEE